MPMRGIANAVAALGNGSYMLNIVSHQLGPQWISSTYALGSGGAMPTSPSTALTFDIGATWYNAHWAAVGYTGRVYGQYTAPGGPSVPSARPGLT